MILLVIDMQKGIVDEDLYAYDTFLDRTVRLVDAARKNNVEVIFVQHDAGKGSGLSVGDEAFEIIDRIRPEQGEKVFVKTINSCFGNKDFKAYMKSQKDKRLMIVGLQTNYCIDATVKSAFERGYDVIIPEHMHYIMLAATGSVDIPERLPYQVLHCPIILRLLKSNC